MNEKHIYLVLCIMGTLLPWSQFAPWMLENGINPSRFFADLFATKISAFFGLDVIVSAIVLFVFIYLEGKRLHMKRLWLPVVSTLVVGVSLGLPLFLAMRHNHVNLHEITE